MKTFVRSIVLSFVAVSAIALTGCSKKDDVPVEIDGQLVEILPSGGSFKGGVVSQSSAASRAVIDAGHTRDLKVAFARIDQKSETDATYPAYSTVAAALPATWTKGFTAANATAISFDVPQYYLTRVTNNNTKLVGWYPHLAANTFSSGEVSIAVDGANDIMLTQELEGNKDATAAFGVTGKIFNFKHKLALLKFRVYAKDSAAVKNGYGKLKAITLKKQLATCKIVLPGDQAGQVTFDYAAAPDPEDMDMVKKAADSTDKAITYPLELPVLTVTDNGDGTSTTKKNDIECGYALIAPVGASGKVSVAIETELGGTKEVDLTLPKDASSNVLGFEAGKAYNIVLCFTTTGIDPTATITEWIKADDIEIEL